MRQEVIEEFLNDVKVELEESANEIYAFLEEREAGETGEICVPSGKITFIHSDDSIVRVVLEIGGEVIGMSWDNPVTDETSSDDLEYWISDLVEDMWK